MYWCLHLSDDWRGPTRISDVVACFVESSWIELKANNGEDDDGEEKKEGDVDEGTNGLSYGWHHNLQAC